MKKSSKIISLFLVFILLLTSCNQGRASTRDNELSSSDTIHIWSYYRNMNEGYLRMLNLVEKYCEDNKIPLEVHLYNTSEITYEDYALKRNLNLTKSNNIVFGEYKDIQDINIKHGDYTKVKKYANLADSFKYLPCITFGYDCSLRLINKEMLDYYNISVDKDIISYNDYIDIIFELIEKGAKFEGDNIFSIRDLYSKKLMKKYNLCIDNNMTESDIDDKYKENLTKAVYDLLDFMKDKPYILRGCGSRPEPLVDTETSLVLESGFLYNRYDIEETLIYKSCSHCELVDNINIDDSIVMVEPYGINCCLFMGENITNDKIYDVVDYFLHKTCLGEYSTGRYKPFKNDYTYYYNNHFGYRDDDGHLIKLGKKYNPTIGDNLTEEDAEYYNKNEEELFKFHRILEDNLFMGNISKELVQELEYSSSKLNRRISGFLGNMYLYSKQRSEEEFDIEKEIEDYITKTKLRL